MSFDELLTFHRNQESTELTLLGVVFTVSLAMIGLFSSDKRVAPTARMLIALVYGLFMGTVLWSLNDSFKVHNALHVHLKAAVAADPHLLTVGDETVDQVQGLGHVFETRFKPLPVAWLLFGGSALATVVLTVILALGKGHVITLPGFHSEREGGSTT